MFGMDSFTEFMNYCGDNAYSFFDWALRLLPGSPFTSYMMHVPAGFTDTMGYLNYFVPISTMLSILSLWLACILTYFVIQLIMRWVKAIE